MVVVAQWVGTYGGPVPSPRSGISTPGAIVTVGILAHAAPVEMSNVSTACPIILAWLTMIVNTVYLGFH